MYGCKEKFQAITDYRGASLTMYLASPFYTDLFILFNFQEYGIIFIFWLLFDQEYGTFFLHQYIVFVIAMDDAPVSTHTWPLDTSYMPTLPIYTYKYFFFTF